MRRAIVVGTLVVSTLGGASTGRGQDSPGPRWGHSLVYDPVGSRVVLFGGAASLAGRFADTWEWKDGRWRRLEAEGPSPRAYHAAAWHVGRRALVVHGGRAPGAAPDRVSLADTWLLEGEQWRRLSESGPSPRDHHGMAWDPNTRAVLLFGGWGEGRVHADTWLLDGDRWSRVDARGPPPRAAHVVVGGSERVVVHGGVWLGGLYADSWEWDGHAWRALAEPYANPTRDHHAATFDPATGRLLLFGGKDFRSEPRRELLRIDDGGRLEELSDAGPPPRYNAAVAWDPSTRRLLVYGGRVKRADDSYRGFDDLWAWDGASWTRLD